MIFVKRSVEPPLIRLVAAVANVASTLPDSVTITSGIDGRHKVGSRHYTASAIDIRSHNFPSAASKRTFITDVLSRLGPGYDMLLEYEGQPNEHFHLEFDPKE